MHNVTQLIDHRQNTYNYTNDITLNLRKGDIVYVDFGMILKDDSNCSVQTKARPVVIIQNDTGNKYSPTIWVTSITSKNKKSNMPTHVKVNKEVGLTYDSTVAIEQVFTVDKKMITGYVGRCPKHIMEQIDMAIEIQTGIMNLDYINQLIDSINEIEEYACKFGFDPEDMKAHVMHIKDLKAYCNQYNYDYNKLVKERLFVKVNEEQGLRNVI